MNHQIFFHNLIFQKDEEVKKNVVSFKDWMINNLKLQKDEIIENAKHNYFTQQKIHNAVIEILEKKKKMIF